MAITNTGPDLVTAIGNALSYTWGQCTRFVAETLSWIPAGLGNANQWLERAQQKGLPTGQTPQVGSVAVWNTGPFGHVAEVVGIIPGGFKVAEENWIGTGITDIRDVTGNALNGLQGFIYKPGDIPVVGGIVTGTQAAVSTAEAVARLPAAVGHGLANATSSTTHNVGTFFKNNIVALVVALIVALVIFGPDESK